MELIELQAPARPCALRSWSNPSTKETHEPAAGWVSRHNDHAELAVRAKRGAAYTSGGCLTTGGTCTPCQAGRGSPMEPAARAGWQGATCSSAVLYVACSLVHVMNTETPMQLPLSAAPHPLPPCAQGSAQDCRRKAVLTQVLACPQPCLPPNGV